MACLHKALEEKRYKYVTLNLNWGEDPQYQDENGRTLLMKLCYFERDTKWSVATAKRLIRIPGTRDIVDSEGRDLLMLCIRNNKIGMAKLVLSDPDFDIGKVDKAGYNALHHAAELGVLSLMSNLVKLMIKFDMNIDVTVPGGLTALMLACRAGHLECARILVMEGRASLTMKDDVHFKGARDWIADSYHVHEGMDPFLEGIILRKRCSSARESNRSRRNLTTMRRTQSANCLLSPRVTYFNDINACSTPVGPPPPSRDGFFMCSVVKPVRHIIRRKRQNKYPNTPTIIFEDDKGETVRPVPGSNDRDDSYVPVLYKLFNDCSIQTSHSFRPPVVKPPPPPEPEPEPEAPKEEEPKSEAEEKREQLANKMAARVKLQKAMKLRKTEHFLNTLKKGAKKQSASVSDKKAVNLGELMANIKKRQTKSEPAPARQNSPDKLKEKFGKLKKATKQLSLSAAKSQTQSYTSEPGVNADISTDSVFH